MAGKKVESVKIRLSEESKLKLLRIAKHGCRSMSSVITELINREDERLMTETMENGGYFKYMSSEK